MFLHHEIGGSARGWSAERPAWDTLQGADVSVAVIPAGSGTIRSDTEKFLREIIDRSNVFNIPCLLVLTKMDLLQAGTKRMELHAFLRNSIELMNLPFGAVHEVSAKRFHGIVELKDLLARYGKPRAWTHHVSDVTSQSEPEQVENLIREACLKEMEFYIMEHTMLKLLSWNASDEGQSVRCDVEIYFRRPNIIPVFFSHVDKVAQRAVNLCTQHLKKKFSFWFHPFVILDEKGRAAQYQGKGTKYEGQQVSTRT